MSPRMAETMASTRRVWSTWSTRNTRAPRHAATAAVARLPAGSWPETEISTGHPAATRSGSCRVLSGETMIRSGSTPVSTARAASAKGHTTPAPHEAATSASQTPDPPSRSAPAAHASRAISGRTQRTPMTSSG